MKKTYLFLTCLLASRVGFTQSINFQQDTTQIFQDADVGAMAFADVDNDGDKDVLITGKGGPILTTLFLNDGIGNFSPSTSNPFQDVFDGDVNFFDADNDGDLDVFITGEPTTSNSSDLYFNNGLGIFALATGNNFETMMAGNNDVGDADGDGDIDIIVTGQNITGLPVTKLYLNNGSGVFTAQANSIFTNLKWGTVRFIDMENDGDLDLINCGQNSSGQTTTILYTNNGNGTFSINNSSAIDGARDSDIAIGDIDGDGDKDFLICGTSGSGIMTKLYLNSGAGIFEELTGTSFAPVFVGAIKLADFDNDSDLDVLVLGSMPGGGPNGVICRIYSNLGSNNYIEVDSLIGAYLSSAAIGDVNVDQMADIIYSGTQFTAPIRGTRLYLNTSNILGVDENVSQHFTIYPNPSNGMISLKSNIDLDLKIYILNASGALLHEENIISGPAKFHLPYPDGIYFLQVKSKDFIETYKIVLDNK